MHSRSEWQAQQKQTSSAAPQSDSHAAVSPMQPWQHTMAVVPQAAQPSYSQYIPPYQHHYPHPNPALNYLDLSAQSFGDEHSRLSPTTSLAHQFAALTSDRHVRFSPPHQPQQYAAIASLGYSDDDVVEEDADADVDAEGDEVNAEDARPDAQLSTAERVAQKRRMKRFRLTHEQTRFLINEFIRQPHPDAAHRERLSNEIPGLSPRQVQVWFQNRRAKMKRLPPEDRARVLDSRMLPDNFDATPASSSGTGPPELRNTGDWMRNPGTSIPTMDHLQQMFVEGVDSIYARDTNRQNERIVSGIESIISSNAYPSPVGTGRSNSVSVIPTQHDVGTQGFQRVFARSNTDEHFRLHNPVQYLSSEMYPTAPRPRNRPESAAPFDRQTSLPAHHPGANTLGDVARHDEEYSNYSQRR